MDEFGCHIHVRGSAQNPTLLLIGGFAENGSMFEPLFETPLADSYRLVALDLPGFGKSPARSDLRTLRDYGLLVSRVARQVSEHPVGLIAHSLGSVVATLACTDGEMPAAGLLSIEGNLTAADAYFSGMAAQFADASAFQKVFLARLDEAAASNPLIARYRAAAAICDEETLWRLGCEAKELGDTPGDMLLSLACRTIYVFSRDNLPARSTAWLAEHPNLLTHELTSASHWPTLDQPRQVAEVAMSFFTRGS